MAAETPLVHRTVRTGGILLLLGAVQFLAVTVWSVSQYPGYSLTSTKPLALASTGLAWGWLFDLSLILGGAISVFGVLLIWSAFDPRPTRGVGLFLLLVASFFAILYGAVSVAPSVSVPVISEWSVYVGSGAVGAGLVLLAFAMNRQERWRVSRAYTLVSGLVVLGSAALYGAGIHLGSGPGTLMLLGLGAALLWPIVEGAHIALLHRFAPGLHVKVAAA